MRPLPWLVMMLPPLNWRLRGPDCALRGCNSAPETSCIFLSLSLTIIVDLLFKNKPTIARIPEKETHYLVIEIRQRRSNKSSVSLTPR